MERVVSTTIITMILPYLSKKISLYRGLFTIKEYYNQDIIISEIAKRTNYSKHEIYDVLNTLPDIIAEKLLTTKEHTEIKVIPGLKILCKYRSKNQVKNVYKNITNKEPHDKLIISAKFTDDYKNKVNESFTKITE